MSDSHPRSPSNLATIEAETAADQTLVGTGLAIRLADDPWSLTHAERLGLRESLAAEQARWLTRLGGLIEPPDLDDSFPAYLLGTPPFSHIAASIGPARRRQELDTGTADELQRFVDHYRSFLIEPSS